MKECKALQPGRVLIATGFIARTPDGQGLTPVHSSAQRKRFLWDRGYIWECFRGCLEGV